MRKFIGDTVIFLLLFFLSMLFLKPVFSATLICGADNNQTYKMQIPKGSHGEFIENIDWIKGRKAGTKQKIVIKDVRNPASFDDYIQFTDGKYTITYSLRCAYE
jgi:hypothetical protein